MRHCTQSIILGAAFFATVALPVGAQASTARMPTAASQASSFQVFPSAPIETLNPRTDGISSTLDPHEEGYKKGYSDGYASGVRSSKQSCSHPDELDPASGHPDTPYWSAYREGYLAGFDHSFYGICLADQDRGP
jgi:hypothetical protein